MKEAAGEANMTVITIVLITAIAAIVIPIITSTISGAGKKSCCQGAGGYMKGNQCYDTANNTVIAESTYWDATNKACNY